MKLTRLILGCTLLLLVSSPLFALPQCGECVNNICEYSQFSHEPCRYNSAGMCETYFKNCTSFAPETPEVTLAADWTVASVEVTHSAPAANAVAAVADVAEVRTTSLTEQ